MATRAQLREDLRPDVTACPDQRNFHGRLSPVAKQS
jgi:hypothetical protein